jgi:signal transduction histidine kinase
MLSDEQMRETLTYKIQYKSERNELIARAAEEKKEAEATQIRNIQFFAIIIFFLLAVFFFISNRQKIKAKRKIETAYVQLKSTQAQLIQSEKMASLGELTAGIAHEIQNPLNFVNNFSEVNKELIDELIGERRRAEGERNASVEDGILDDIAQNLEKINHHGKRADAIVKGMLQHSRTSSGQKESTDINALCDEYLRLAYQGFRARDKSFNATFSTEFDNGIDKVDIVRPEIGRVILNLINNAFYAVNERSKQGVLGYEPSVIVGTRRLKDRIEISVKDNGKGIPASIKEKIFQPFFTTKPTGQGTGLGLSLAYDIVKAHGGEIRVETEEGKGSDFIVQLPVA